MTEHGFLAYDLAPDWCEECGRAKLYRLWPGTLTGCATCDEVITRHRCTARPEISEVADGQSWECRDCGSTWTAGSREEPCPDCCGDCGHTVTARWWNVIEGDRIDTAPRHKPQPWTPLRNALRQSADALLSRPAVSPANGRYPRTPLGSCYRMAGGSVVHVKPGCRC